MDEIIAMIGKLNSTDEKQGKAILHVLEALGHVSKSIELMEKRIASLEFSREHSKGLIN